MVMPMKHCACGWRKPLVAVTTRSGARPGEALLVAIVCPECETPYSASEMAEPPGPVAMAHLALRVGGPSEAAIAKAEAFFEPMCDVCIHARSVDEATARGEEVTLELARLLDAEREAGRREPKGAES